MNTPLTDDELQALAQKRVGMMMGFLTHLLVFVCVNGGLALVGFLKHGEVSRHLPIWGWGLGLAIHGVVTWINLSGLGLRQRLMDSELRRLRAGQD